MATKTRTVTNCLSVNVTQEMIVQKVNKNDQLQWRTIMVRWQSG